MVTSRAVLFAFIGGCFYLIAIVNALPPLFYALMWLTAGIVTSCFGIALLSLYGLRTWWRLEAKGVAQAAPDSVLAAARDDGEVASGSSSSLQPSQAWDYVAGASVGLRLEIGNAGTFNKSGLVIEVHLRAREPALEFEPGEAPEPGGVRDVKARAARAGAVTVRRFLIEALPSRAVLLTFLPLHDLERGRYEILLVRAVGSDVLGLFRPRKKIPSSSLERAVLSQGLAGADADSNVGNANAGDAVVVVGPRVVRLGRGGAGPALGSGGRGNNTAAQAGRSDEFGGTRPYVAGDDLRFVHWKSTARRGEMVVREWERATLRRSVVLWDGAAFPFPVSAQARRGSSRRQPRKAEQVGVLGLVKYLSAHRAREAGLGRGESSPAWQRGVEWSLEIALSLTEALAAGGEPCALWRLDTAPARVEIANAAALARAAELLADARAERTAPLSEAVQSVLSQGQAATRDLEARSFLFALSGSPSLLAAARRLRHVTVVLIDISRLDNEHSTRAHQAAWRGWNQALDEAESMLREAGLRVLRLPPEPSDQPQALTSAQNPDSATREALRLLLDERPEARPRSRAGEPAPGARGGR